MGFSQLVSVMNDSKVDTVEFDIQNYIRFSDFVPPPQTKLI
jgi:hypothetical protein